MDSGQFNTFPTQSLHIFYGPLSNWNKESVKESKSYNDSSCLSKSRSSQNIITEYNFDLIWHMLKAKWEINLYDDFI